MDHITTFLMQMVGLSVAAERVTETIKTWILPILGKMKVSAQFVSAVVQIVAVASGIFVAALSQLNPLTLKEGWVNWAVTGLLTCGGSAFWNHLLDIVQATKVQKQKTAFNVTAAAPADLMVQAAAGD